MSGSLAKALLFSFAIHITLAVVLILGDFSSPPKPKSTAMQVQPIQAVVVDKSQIDKQLNKLKKKKSDEVKRIKQKKEQAEAAKRKRAKEKERLKQLKQKKERDRKRAKDKAKKAEAAKQLRLKKAAEKKRKEKAAAEKAKRLKAAKKAEQLKKKKAAEKKRKEKAAKAKAAKEKARQEQILSEQMAEEMAVRQQARQQQMMTEVGRYTALITRAIQSNLITDKSSMENKSCKLTIKLAPSGFVINVISGKGDRIVCDAASKAIYKAGKLPVSKDPEVFEKMRTISLTVVPEF